MYHMANLVKIMINLWLTIIIQEHSLAANAKLCYLVMPAHLI